MAPESIPQLVLEIVLAILTLVATFYVKDKQRREEVAATMAELHSAVRSTVRSFEQTRVPKAKQESGAPKLDEGQGVQLRSDAIDGVIDMVASGKLDALASRLHIDADKVRMLLGNLVEAEVFEIKREDKPAA